MFLERNLTQEDVRSFSVFLAHIRAYMAELGINEVVTSPLVSRRVPDAGVDIISVNTNALGEGYLHTSPEWEMKKALSRGVGDIYQLATVFRDDPVGKRHHPSFLMLEWYQVGIDEQALIKHCCGLFKALGYQGKVHHHHIKDLYMKCCGFDVFEAGVAALCEYAVDSGLNIDGLSQPDLKQSWMDLIWVNQIEPGFAKGLHIVDRFPVEQAALSELSDAPYAHAKRFEIYLEGAEVANGYKELCDVDQLSVQFDKLGSEIGLDRSNMVDAGDISGLPECAGVSIGVERVYQALKAL